VFEALYHSEIAPTLWVQSWGDWLAPLMLFITNLGYTEGYILLLTLIYWCIDTRLGLRLGLLLTASASINALLKLGFHAPRPYWLDTRVQAWDAPVDFGMPSNHAQSGVAFWGLVASAVQRMWTWMAALLLIALTGLSRIYLGVHFPSQVVVGWGMGALLLFLFLRLEGPLTQRLAAIGPWRQLGWALMASLGLLVTGVGLTWIFRAWTVPPDWLTIAARAAPANEPLPGLVLDDTLQGTGFFLGVAAGAIVINVRGGFRVTGAWPRRLLRYGVGIVLIALLLAGTEWVEFQLVETGWFPIWQYVSAGLVSFFAVGAAPVLFGWLRLADSSATGDE